MKSIIILIFLSGCVSRQFHQRQLDEQKKATISLYERKSQEIKELKSEIEQLQTIRNRQQKTIFNIEHRKCEENKSTKTIKRTVCVVADDDEICIDFLVEEEEK